MDYTEIAFPYGDSVIRARIPAKNLSAVLSTRDAPGLKDEAAAITRGLRAPIGSPPLRDRLKRSDRVVVIVTDNTRPCPDDRILPPVLAELETVVPRENITIIVALGLHPPLDRATLIKKLGKVVVESYRVLNHDVNNTVNIGTTTRGTPVDINRLVVEADFRLSTGFIEPHIFAGFSGGRKSIAPGVFSVRAAYHNHGYRMIEDVRSRPGVLKGNPIHEDMVEQARMARLDFIVNVLLNKKRGITHVFAGDFVQAHEKGCQKERQICGVPVDHKVDITITTNNGAPLDLDLYQTVKGIDNASAITREGGIVITASSCRAGIGPGSFYDLHACVSAPKEVTQKIRREGPIGVQWENQILARIQSRHDLYLVSGLPDKTVRDMMLTPFATIEAAVEKAVQVLGQDAEIAAIPEGSLVLPILRA